MATDSSFGFIGQIIGGIISGVAGILVASYTIRKKTKQEVIETIYIPLYDEIMKLEIEPFFDSVVDNIWTIMASHKKVRTDKTVKELFLKYENLGKEHRELWNDWIHAYRSNEVVFVSSIKEVFNSFGITFTDDNILLTSANYIPFSYFVAWSKWILFDNKIKDGKELYKKLLDYINPRHPEMEAWLKNLHEENPDFFNQLFVKLKVITKDFPYGVDYEKLIVKRIALKELIIQIREELRKRIKT